MFCPKCGNPIPEQSDYCPYCGAPVEFQQPTQPGYPAQPGYQAQQPPQHGYAPQPGQPQAPIYVTTQPKSDNKVLIICLAVIAVALLGACAWLLLGRNSGDNSATAARVEASTATHNTASSTTSLPAHGTDGTYSLTGSMGNAAVKGEMYRDGNKLYGKYGYGGRTDGIIITGEIDGNTASYIEYNPKHSEICGAFDGHVSQQTADDITLSGTFTNSKGSSFNTRIKLSYSHTGSVPTSVLSSAADARQALEYYSGGPSSYTDDYGTYYSIIGRSNVRYSPSSSSGVAYQLADGTVVRVIDKNGRWYQLDDGYWTHEQNLRPL